MNTLTLRDCVAIAFRRQRIIAISFGCIFGVIALILFLQPDVYDAEMKILVKQNRVDPMVSPDPSLPSHVDKLTEQDLSSEAELLKSRDVLERAAVECNVRPPQSTFWAWVPVVNVFAAASAPTQPRKVDLLAVSQAVRDLETDIRAIPLRNSNLISVTYPSKNPTLAGCVLNNIAKLYMEKHIAMHRPGGAFEFFKQEADRYAQELERIEGDLTAFGQKEQLVTEGTEKDISVRKLGDYTSALLDTKTAIAETQARIRKLEALNNSTQPRQTKTVRTAPNEALKDLQTQLTTLEIKRTEMQGKFNPEYRPLQDLERQIESVKNTMAEAQQRPLVEETTDTNPANDWVKLELTKAYSDLATMQASLPAKEHAAKEYRTMVLDLDQKNIKRSDLVRLAKATEEKYLLYLHKQEEARIEQELDKQRIMNVALAEEPIIPLLPEPSQMPIKFGFAGLLAAMLSLGIGFGSDHYDRSLRTPQEVQTFVGVPVIASLPLIGNPNVAWRNENL